MMTGEDLKETYFRRRRENEELRKFTSLFEGQPWYAVGETQQQCNAEDGSRLLVYATGNDGVVICVITAAGEEYVFEGGIHAAHQADS